MLQRELGRLAKEQGTLAVLVLEVANYQALAEEHGKEQAFALLRDISRMAQELSGSQARLFHYKADPQLAVLYPNLDADGASLFSLTLLEKVNAAQWKVRDARVFLELILGFSARAGAEQSADDLLAGAENLLEMQKV
jgi:PleD family two-component response regulator